MTKLSVNLNKIALLRNSRDTTIPSVTAAAETSIAAGAQGITVHPRPDMRHIRPADVLDLASLLKQPQYADIELNIEGNPFAGPEANGFPGFMTLVRDTLPQQCTLVPDDPIQLTSDHGWDLSGDNTALKTVIDELKGLGIRVSLFMDPIAAQIEHAAALGADRIEFYTGPYADQYGDHESVLATFIEAGKLAQQLSLGINAGHDLNQDNLGEFCQRVKPVAEVSIGHALISDALWDGLATTVRRYNTILEKSG
ncbi:MAG: pyridoxine 5'-phosphate synthase [SAR86 cluster bacterium]|jgi:pyridoxine 5-phosphate synthase|uniref:Pyridoxine 5'-phosphate synthase n=1 Tax=SAR86 cluster bacterium TaxID=2030880 RepID=A0A972W094_9GAMM|nr:pyridoxine 5'-phosphate synthase [SAR86 cluster bacterium]|tara:strand:+ start:662 stop:1423 length:762 start_codon:yes stop_codon:yes gene_type:complete